MHPVFGKIFEGKSVIITGGSRGIGRGIAEAFAACGARVALTYQSNKTAADEVLATLPKVTHGRHGAFQFDVSLPEQVDQNFEKILNEFNNVTVLVNNAGITRDQLLLRLKPDDWDAVLTTNLKSAFNTTKFISKAWLRSKTPGSIINITSVIGQTGNAGQSNYAASKAGLIGFTKSVALELASRQIRANCVAPGFIRSDMTEALNEGQKTAIIDRVPLGSMGTPHDVASACVFLGSEAARYITGQTINVDGGLVMI